MSDVTITSGYYKALRARDDTAAKYAQRIATLEAELAASVSRKGTYQLQYDFESLAQKLVIKDELPPATFTILNEWLDGQITNLLHPDLTPTPDAAGELTTCSRCTVLEMENNAFREAMPACVCAKPCPHCATLRAALVRTASSLRKLHAVDTDAEQALATTPPAQEDTNG